MIELFFWLVVVHCVTDFPLQGDFLAKAKNFTTPIPGVPWVSAMLAHVIISGGGVALVTGSIELGIAEVICHFVIDYWRCAGKFSFNQDQYLHIFCRFVWAVLV